MAPLVMVACFFLVRFLSCFKVCLNFQVMREGVQFVLLLRNIVRLVGCWSVVEESLVLCLFNFFVLRKKNLKEKRKFCV